MQNFLTQFSESTEILMILSVILFAGFVMTRLTNTLNLPKVSGYILAGILIGPCCMDFIPSNVITHMAFVSDLALAFIAFGVGKFFKREVLMRTGRDVVIITLFESLVAGVLVTLLLKFMFRLDWPFALVLGSIATATAPASTMMTINQYKAKGEFVDTLLQIVALDDVVCLLAFSVVSAIANGLAGDGIRANDIVIPIVLNLLAILFGFFCGYFLSQLLIPTRSKDNRLILAIAMLLGISGICAAVDISPLLSCMVFGATYINLTEDKKLFRQINNFTPPVMSLFFIVSGMNLDVKALAHVGVIGVAYFVIRIIGKYLGTYVSCQMLGKDEKMRNYMGLALIPQAGVAIGLAFLGQRLLPEETGTLMLTIILSSSVLYEMIGPISAKLALIFSGSIKGARILEAPPKEETLDARKRRKGGEHADEDHGADVHEEESHLEETEEAEDDGHGEGGEPAGTCETDETGGEDQESESLEEDGEAEDQESESSEEDGEPEDQESESQGVDGEPEGQEILTEDGQEETALGETPAEHEEERETGDAVAGSLKDDRKKAGGHKKKKSSVSGSGKGKAKPMRDFADIVNEMEEGVNEMDDLDVERCFPEEMEKKKKRKKKK